MAKRRSKTSRSLILAKAELEAELSGHRLKPVLTQTKKEMQVEFDSLRKGITTLPALLTSDPERDITEMNIRHYEVSPCEPLHDFKGHMSNVIGEIKKQVTSNTKAEVEKVTTAMLGKDTLRCVDYRKATILLSNALHQTNADPAMCKLLDTAVEICQLMYAREEKRSPKAVLRMHNVTLVHATLCIQLPTEATNHHETEDVWEILPCNINSCCLSIPFDITEITKFRNAGTHVQLVQ